MVPARRGSSNTCFQARSPALTVWPLAEAVGQVLATGTPAEVQAHPDVVAAYLGD